MPFTLVQVSDIHLDPGDAEHRRRLEVVRQAVQAAEPDLIVISGDISDDGYARDDMFERIYEELDRFEAPFFLIPGNHDVGDKFGEQNEVRREYLDKWLAAYKTDRFCVRRDGWIIIGINSQVLGSGLDEETEQFAWLERTLGEADQRNDQIALFLHAAPFVFDPDEVLEGPSQYWGFHPDPRRELLRRILRPSVRLLANGHLHWYRSFQRDGTLHVWCPATKLIVDDAIFPRGGDRIGFIRYTFGTNGVEHELVPLDLPSQKIHFYRRQVELPGREPITMADLVLDFTGTLSKDGHLLPSVRERLERLAKRIRITILTADTFGKAEQELAGLPVELQLISTGADKQDSVEALGAGSVVAIGNGRNDMAMVQAAALGIAVLGPEGAAGDLVRCADVLCRDIGDALDLVENPLRLKATLRD